MADRFYITQYHGNITVMERVENDYLNSRRIVTFYHVPNDVRYTANELAEYLADQLNTQHRLNESIAHGP